MKEIQIKKNKLVGTLVGWWFVVIVLAVNGWNPFGVLYVIGVPFLLLVPGLLTMSVLRVSGLPVESKVLLGLGISIFELMVVGLLANTILPYYGMIRPLDTTFVAWTISTFFLLLLFLSWWRLPDIIIPLPRLGVVEWAHNSIFVLLPFAFVFMGVLGALHLNEGGANTLTMVLLVGIALYSWFLYRHAEELQRAVIPTALFFVSLSLLLMTSMRGTFIAGHDIQREFFVFQLAKDYGMWSMINYLDAYNACLSITILPTLFANILHIPDPYVFKVLFQVIFAAAPVVAYLIARRWLTTPYAFLSGLFFVSFPTFFQDMPFLARQEIAFLFYGLMLYVLFEDAFSKRIRSALLVLFGLGVVLSHYSTTYTIIFILLLTTLTTPIVFRIARYVRRKAAFAKSSFGFSMEHAPLPVRRVTLSAVLTITLAALLWTSVITHTDRHVKDVVGEIWGAVAEGVNGDSRSVDVLVLFSLGRVQHDRTLDEYVENVVMPLRAEEPDAYYATSTFAQYELVTVPPTELPLTSVGNIPSDMTPNFAYAVTFIGQLLAKLIQLAILIGFAYVLFRRTWSHRIDTEYYLLAGYALFFVFLCVALPLLSVEYGVFRALQQSLFLLAPFMVVGVLVLGTGFTWLLRHWYQWSTQAGAHVWSYNVHAPIAAGLLGVFFLLYATGFMTQLVGGNVPPVHLNNVGDDYDHYVTEAAEVEAIHWLLARLQEDMEQGDGVQPVVQADRFGQKKLRAFILERVAGDIMPAMLRKDAYVYVGPSTLKRGIAVVNYDQARIKYVYPIEFLDENKEVVYDNGSVRIYK